MNNKPPVSIIVPAYNAEKYIERTLDSLAQQTLKDLEIIVVDDASTDGTSMIVKAFQSQTQLNIVYLPQVENQGVHNARLLGLQHAKGEWIGFVDADDTVDPVMYQTMHDAGERSHVDIVVCGAYRVSENGKRLSTKVRFKKEAKVSSGVFQQFCQLKFGTGTLWNKLYRRDVIMPFKSLYFPWRQDINEDMLLNIGCFSEASSVLTIKEILYHYTYNPNSVSSRIDPALAFVGTFRAYALAVSCFRKNFNSKMMMYLTDLYRTQLARPSYRVDELKKLQHYTSSLVEAINQISDSYPLGMALLASRTEPRIGVKRFCQLLFKRFTNKKN